MEGISNTHMIIKPSITSDSIALKKEYDAFISYEKSMQEKINRFGIILEENLGMQIIFDSPQIEMSESKEYKRLLRRLMNSKFVICCINQAYTRLNRFKDQLIIAYLSSKPILIIFFEEISSEDLKSFRFLTNNFEKSIHINQFLVNKESWFEKFMVSLTAFVEEIIDKKQLNDFSMKEDQLFIKLVQNDFKKVEIMKIQNSQPVGNISIISDNTTSSTQEKPIKDDMKHIYLNPSIIKRFNTISMVQFAFGFNRIVWLECRERFLITSSYFKSIISVDKIGKWIERRNPGGVLQQPFAICLDSKNNVYIGDNKLKCIFVFDSQLEYLKTISQDLLNGFYDIVIDDRSKALYAVDFFNGVVASIDINKNVILNSVSICTPTYVGIISHSVIVLTSNDVVYLINDKTFKVIFKFEIKKGVCLNALWTLSDLNIVFLTCHEVLSDNSKSKNVYLCVVKIDENKSLSTRKLSVEFDQVNDMVFTKNSIAFINDTHVGIFTYQDIGGLIKWIMCKLF
jgi:hypothetical protein